MKLFFGLSFILFITSLQLIAQPFTNSNLPIVLITTDGNAEIPDEPKIFGSMKIIYAGEGNRNFVSDQNNTSKLNYNGRIGIEVRGSSSQFLPKKQYSLTTFLADNATHNNVSLLGMPAESDWILNGIAFDSTLIRDYISYILARKIGNYAPRVKYCEVMLNGSYIGLYFLQEKIKADDNRVDVVKIDPSDNTLPDLSGGYITKVDRSSGDDPTAWTMSSYLGTDDIGFVHVLPKSSNVTTIQTNYIKSQFDKLSVTAQTGNSSITNGYPSVIDIPSFVDYMLINEISANVDAYQLSTYFHKDKNGKLRAGPVWDLNLTFGNDLFLWGLDRSKTDLWQFDNGDNVGPKLWKDLFDNNIYKCYLSKRWNELTQVGAPLHLNSINSLIDETVLYISEATAREQVQWGTVGDHAFYIKGVKKFLTARINWMTANIGPFNACNAVQIPPLVITQIMYHPQTSIEFPDSNDQEYIEIFNNGNDDVNLSGYYFSNTGFVFQFPLNSILPGQGIIQLANKREIFQQLHGYSPFGQFTRNLSNESQKLILADAFGNKIDEVEYLNQSPWPNVTDNGFHLKLIDVNLDNNIGSNWVASNDPITSNVVATEQPTTNEIQLYPNPFDDLIIINSPSVITTLHLRDLEGRVLENFQTGVNTTTLDLRNLSKGMYILTLVTQDKTVVRKVVKK